MKPMLNHENGYLMMELSPFQCANLAEICYFASDESFDERIELWQTLAAFFHVCAIAGYACWHMSEPDLEAFLHQLDLLNLRGKSNDDDNDNDIGKFNGHKG